MNDHRHTPEHPHAHDHPHGPGHDHRHDHDHNHQRGQVHGHGHGHDQASAAACTTRAGSAAGGVAAAACCAAAPLPIAPSLAPPGEGARNRSLIRILQMDCATEEALIRDKLQSMPSVLGLEFNLMKRVLAVAHQPGTLDQVLATIRTLGFEPQLLQHGRKPDPAPDPAQAANWPLALAALAGIAAEATHWLDGPAWLSALLALLAVAISGLGTYRKGLIALRNGHLNINALMTIAVTGALILQQWPEAAMVMVLFAISERIEAHSLRRARNAIRGLLQLAPSQASVLQPDGNWLTVPAAGVSPGASIRVKPGERIALDGTILRGNTSIDQAPITGESMPVDKGVGDPVFAGTINGAGAFDYRVTSASEDSLLSRIIHAVEEAQGSKAPTQRFVDRFARIYTPVVVLLAVALALLPPLLIGGAWWDWIYKALVLLVIACPCALVISTPVTIVSGLAAAARKGILVKGGAFLEQGRTLAWIALDKTGTLTLGKPVQTLCELAPGVPDALAQARRHAASLAARSDHPVSQAIASAARADGVPALEVADFQAVPGQGVQGVVEGRLLRLGNHRMVHDLGLCSPALEARLEQLERAGNSVVMLVDAQRAIALFAVADSVRPQSRAAVAQLHALGLRTLMLTGDNPHTAQAIAQQVGITEVRGNQLPQDKLAAITELAGRAPVGMVGDGINDAPALARADIGFAMGALGTDTAIETADVALMDDDLNKLATFVRLSRRTHRILVQNIVLALGIKAVFLVLTVAGLGTMWMAVFADVGASLLVVGNGLRLMRG